MKKLLLWTFGALWSAGMLYAWAYIVTLLADNDALPTYIIFPTGLLITGAFFLLAIIVWPLLLD